MNFIIKRTVLTGGKTLYAKVVPVYEQDAEAPLLTYDVEWVTQLADTTIIADLNIQLPSILHALNQTEYQIVQL